MKFYRLTIHHVTQDQQMYIYSDETKEEVEKKARRAMSKGIAVTWPNGKTQWKETHPILTDSDSWQASDKYIWHSDGDHIKCTDILKTEGEEDQVLKTRFVHYDKVF